MKLEIVLETITFELYCGPLDLSFYQILLLFLLLHLQLSELLLQKWEATVVLRRAIKVLVVGLDLAGVYAGLFLLFTAAARLGPLLVILAPLWIICLINYIILWGFLRYAFDWLFEWWCFTGLWLFSPGASGSYTCQWERIDALLFPLYLLDLPLFLFFLLELHYLGIKYLILVYHIAELHLKFFIFSCQLLILINADPTISSDLRIEAIDNLLLLLIDLL